MTDGSERGPQADEVGSEEARTAVVPGVAGMASSTVAPAGGGEHAVSDADPTHGTLEAAAREVGERRSVAEIAGLAGEEREESAAGFYVILGLIVAALLVAVTWLSGSRHEVDETEISRPARSAPASRPPLSVFRSPSAFSAPGGPRQPFSPGPASRSTPVPPFPPAGTASSPDLPQARRAEPRPPVTVGPMPGEPNARSPGLPPATIVPPGGGRSPYGTPAPPESTLTPPRAGTTALPPAPLRQ